MKNLSGVCARVGVALLLATSVVCAQNNNGNGNANGNGNQGSGGAKTPNILFIIMDDVGIDQLTVFGYGLAADAAKTPNIDAIAHAGVRFRNVWAMPECSPSRAVFFEGRYPLRTNVYGALLDDDLANSQVSPYEYTTPRLLKTRGYDSGDFGKFHLGQVMNNPFKNNLVPSLGWDYFDGFLDGAPHPIDTTAGGINVSVNSQPPPYSSTCGYIPNKVDGGADTGSCRFVNNSCQDLSVTPAHPTPGRYCLEQGGIFVPDNTCRQTPSPAPDFQRTNGYYVWPRVTNRPNQPPQLMDYERGFVGEATTTSAVNWINAEQSANKSWMATVAFPQIHTPYQQVPPSLIPNSSLDLSNLNCTGNKLDNLVAFHLLSNQMLESMDTEIGRLMVQTGLATYNPDGSLNYQPDKSNTMVVLIGDNGTYAPGVRLPFNPSRAKAFVYQTGVWVPLVIAGPMVSSPDRDVASMINIADLYQLFGEIAGIDVRNAVPSSHIIDSEPMLRYLTNSNQPSIRKTNFTQTGNNIHPMAPSPCLVVLGVGTPTCAQLFTSKALCEDEGGNWYGKDSDSGVTYPSCCALQTAVTDGTFPDPSVMKVNLLPNFQQAIRNQDYKLVRIEKPDCSQQPDNHGEYPSIPETAFYPVDEGTPVPELDNADKALCGDQDTNPVCPKGLLPNQKAIYNRLLNDMTNLLMSEPACPGDGNEDKVVDALDIQSWQFFNQFPQPQSSWSDFNLDGSTNGKDLAIILAHFGDKCPAKK